MKELKIKEIQIVSGGMDYGLLLDMSLTSAGACIGASSAYIKPFIDSGLKIMRPMGPIDVTLNPMSALSGALLGAGVCYGISKGIQAIYHSFEKTEPSSV